MAHADVFQKNEKKNKTTSVYRLDVNGRRTLRSVLAISFRRPSLEKIFILPTGLGKKFFILCCTDWGGKTRNSFAKP